MAQNCPTCGQPLPEALTGQAPPAPAAPTPPPKKFPTVKVAIISGVAVVVLLVGYLVFGGRKPLVERLYAEQQDVRDTALAELANVEPADRAPVIGTLAGNLGGTDARLRTCALDIMLRLKLPAEDTRPVLPGLQALMRGPESPVAMQALAASRYVAPRPVDVQAACMEVLKSQAGRLSSTEFLAVLNGIGLSLSPTGDVVPGLAATLTSLALTTADPTVRMSALGFVAMMSSTAQAEAGSLVAQGAFSSTTILQGLQDPVPASRSALLAGLLRIVPKSVDLAPQLSLLAKDPAPVLRITAAEVLMSSTPTSSAGWVAATGLLKDPVVEVRRATVVAMKPRGKELPKMTVTALIALLKDKDEGVREDAAAALTPLASPRVKQALSAYTKAKVAAEAAAEAAATGGASATEEGAATTAAPGEGAATAAPGEGAATTAAPGEGATTAAPGEGAATAAVPGEGAATTAAPAEAASGAAASPCGSSPEKATALAKDHLPRSMQGTACKDALEFSVLKSETEPCIFYVTASCKGEKVGTCEVDGNKGTYFWSQ